MNISGLIMRPPLARVGRKLCAVKCPALGQLQEQKNNQSCLCGFLVVCPLTVISKGHLQQDNPGTQDKTETLTLEHGTALEHRTALEHNPWNTIPGTKNTIPETQDTADSSVPSPAAREHGN